MKKILSAMAVVSALTPSLALAQQYTYPIYAQDSGGYGQYGQASAPAPAVTTYQQNITPAPATNANVIPLSSGSYNYAPPAVTGSGTAFYGNASVAAPAVPAYAPVATPSFGPQDSYATAAASPRLTRSAYNWSGCYLGAYGGGAFGGKTNAGPLLSQGGTFAPGTAYNITGSSYSYDNGSGFVGGGTLGCNYQIPLRQGYLTGVVLGVEGEFGDLSLTGSTPDVNSGNVAHDTVDHTKLTDWDGIVAGRVGAAFDRTFLYGKFGAVFANAKSSVTDGCTTGNCGTGTIDATSGNKQIIDAALGGGVEYALSDRWSLKGEYMYLDTTDSFNVCGAGGGSAAGSNFCSEHELNGTHMVKVGLNYHFNSLFGGGTSPRW